MIAKITEIIFRIKDYDRLESNYCKVLDMVTGGRLSKPNYTIDTIRQAFNDYLDELEEDKIETLNTEYEKGRADVIVEIEKCYEKAITSDAQAYLIKDLLNRLKTKK